MADFNFDEWSKNLPKDILDLLTTEELNTHDVLTNLNEKDLGELIQDSANIN